MHGDTDKEERQKPGSINIDSSAQVTGKSMKQLNPLTESKYLPPHSERPLDSTIMNQQDKPRSGESAAVRFLKMTCRGWIGSNMRYDSYIKATRPRHW